MPTTSAAAALEVVVPHVDEVLERFLRERRDEAVRLDPAAVEPIDEIARLVHAGGKRLRPAFCYWGYRAAGGSGQATPPEGCAEAGHPPPDDCC